MSASATIALLILTGVRFEDQRLGDPDLYWRLLCRFDAPDDLPSYAYSGKAYPPLHGGLFYVLQEHHSQLLFRVSFAEASAALPGFLSRLAAASPPDHAADALPCLQYARSPLPNEQIVQELFRLAASNHSAAEVRLLERRVSQNRRVWFALAFEGAFLVGWLGLLFLPWLVQTSRSIRLLCLALLPTALFAPYFLGYAPMLFTHGPSGGFVYSAYATLASTPLLSFPCLSADGWLMSVLPRPLSALVILPGTPAAYSMFACVGPSGTLVLGAALAGIAAAASQISRLTRRIWTPPTS